MLCFGSILLQSGQSFTFVLVVECVCLCQNGHNTSGSKTEIAIKELYFSLQNAFLPTFTSDITFNRYGKRERECSTIFLLLSHFFFYPECFLKADHKIVIKMSCISIIEWACNQ